MTAEQIEQLDKHLRSARNAKGVDPDARVFAFWDDRPRTFPDELEIEGARWRLVRATSELAIREALLDREEEEFLAIVTPLRARDLAYDVRARIAKHSLFVFDAWESLLPMFQATQVDVRLRGNQELGRALLRCSTSAGFRPAKTGVLQIDEAWGAYFAHALGLDQEPTEVDGWVQWFIDNPVRAAELVSRDERLRSDVVARAVDRCGSGVRLAFDAVARAASDGVDIGTRLHAVAHGVLAARNAVAAGDDAEKTATQFLVRLEQFFGDNPVPESDRQTFAEEVLRTDGVEGDVGPALDALLEQAHALEIARFSDVSPAGYRDRRQRLGELCVAHLRGGASRDELVAGLADLERHERFGAEDPAHRRRIRSLCRLAARMATAGRTDHPERAEALALDYLHEGSFIDVLREQLEQGDLGSHFADAASDVLEAAYTHSTERNRRFATTLSEELSKSSHLTGTFFVHEMIRVVLGPLVAERKVMLLVVDGLSWFVLRQLTDDAAFADWKAFVPAKDEQTRPMLATLPSVTNFSRTSLLTGSLQTGTQHNEKGEFAASPHLVANMGNRHDAVLFHQGELDADGRGKVGSAVVEALQASKNRVVGVVLNAVDDQLAGSAQLAFDWKVETVAPLRSLIELAQETGRDILVVSDHGFVWESGSAKVESGESARYRATTTPAGEGEVEVTGPMIEAAGHARGIVAAYDERVRYTGGKRGYHGGASLQEMVSPCVLLTRSEAAPDASRWEFLSLDPPAWWRFGDREHTIQPRDATGDHRPGSSTDGQLSLIEPSEVADGHEVSDWLRRLVKSEQFERRLQAVPNGPEIDRVIALLATLDANGGRAHEDTLAEATENSRRRIVRFISAVKRVLNVEGFQALEHHRGDRFVELHRDLLKRQFQLEDEDG